MDEQDKILYQGRFLSLIDRGGWEFVARENCTCVVLILALTDDGGVVLVEQNRPAMGGPVIELPAGLVDLGEPPECAARRELLEETGYLADRIDAVASGPISPGLTDETVMLFRASGLHKEGPGGGCVEEGESITVHVVASDQIDSWLADRHAQGMHVDLKVYAGLYFLA